jgi:hypothetical protein
MAEILKIAAVSRRKDPAKHVPRPWAEHVSPIEWENVILYGQYVLNPDDIR